MSEIRQFRQNDQIFNGITAETNLKMFDIIPGQHENLATNTNKQVKISIAQTLCEPVAVCSTNNPQNGQYTATCVNFPDFAVSFVDSNSVRHNLVGLKLRVIFEHGITYGSVADGTFPTLSINESEALPLLAQGKTMAQGAIVAGQSVEFTIIPFGNSIAFDADSNVRENTNDYTIYTDGTKILRYYKVEKIITASITSGTYTDLVELDAYETPCIIYVHIIGHDSNYTVYEPVFTAVVSSPYTNATSIQQLVGNATTHAGTLSGSFLYLRQVSAGNKAMLGCYLTTNFTNNDIQITQIIF